MVFKASSPCLDYNKIIRPPCTTEKTSTHDTRTPTIGGPSVNICSPRMEIGE